MIATCAVIGGADSWEAIASYGRSKEPFFRRFLTLNNGIPSHDTFYRVFATGDPNAFAAAFGRWMAWRARRSVWCRSLSTAGRSAG